MEEVIKTKSPVPKKVEIKIAFSYIFHNLLQGEKIHKLEWEDRGYYAQLRGGILHLHKPDNTWHTWKIGEEDIKGEDYIVID